MTDNTQELDEVLDGIHETGCSVIEGMDYPRSVAAGMYTCDCSALDAKQAILAWHNKQTLELLDRLLERGEDFTTFGDGGRSVAVEYIEAERNKLKEPKL